MKYAILSDVHANLDALKGVLADAARCGVQQVVSLGDVVGYGLLPAETLRLLRTAATLALAGNHDDAVAGRMNPESFIGLAGDAVERHRKALARDDLAWLKSLPHTATIESAVLAHGDLTSPADFLYIDTAERAAENFSATKASLVFVGHTHVPMIHLTGQSGRIYALDAEDFMLEDGKRYIVNVGSVGYPRETNGACYSSYAIYDTDERSVRFRKLAFSVSSVLQRGRDKTRRTRILLLGLTAAGLLLAGLCAALLGGRKQKPGLQQAPVAVRTVELHGHEKTVSARIKLTPTSPKGILTISYLDAQGRELTPVSLPLTRSSNRKFAVPADAVRATFALRPAEPGEKPTVREFTPAAE